MNSLHAIMSERVSELNCIRTVDDEKSMTPDTVLQTKRRCEIK